MIHDNQSAQIPKYQNELNLQNHEMEYAVPVITIMVFWQLMRLGIWWTVYKSQENNISSPLSHHNDLLTTHAIGRRKSYVSSAQFIYSIWAIDTKHIIIKASYYKVQIKAFN